MSTATGRHHVLTLQTAEDGGSGGMEVELHEHEEADVLHCLVHAILFNRQYCADAADTTWDVLPHVTTPWCGRTVHQIVEARAKAGGAAVRHVAVVGPGLHRVSWCLQLQKQGTRPHALLRLLQVACTDTWETWTIRLLVTSAPSRPLALPLSAHATHFRNIDPDADARVVHAVQASRRAQELTNAVLSCMQAVARTCLLHAVDVPAGGDAPFLHADTYTFAFVASG